MKLTNTLLPPPLQTSTLNPSRYDKTTAANGISVHLSKHICLSNGKFKKDGSSRRLHSRRQDFNIAATPPLFMSFSCRRLLLPCICCRASEEALYMGNVKARKGYAGGDEARMLQRHLIGTTIKVGSGPNRAKIAASFLRRYDVMQVSRKSDTIENAFPFEQHDIFANKFGDGIGVVILDDGMQHWSLSRDLEIVMLNCISLWGNGKMIPRGPLRESLKALRRADMIVLHHADLISNEKHQYIRTVLEDLLEQKMVPTFYSRFIPCYFFRMQSPCSKVPLDTVNNMVVLCVSGIGCPESLSLAIQKLGAAHVERVDFSDHHNFQHKDLEKIQKTLQKLKDESGKSAIVVLTEKFWELRSKIQKDVAQQSDPAIVFECKDLYRPVNLLY